jgi:hypothetical protein
MDLISGALLVGSMYTAYEVIDRLDIGGLIASKFKSKSNYCLTLGHTKGVLKKDIIVDFRITPHLLTSSRRVEWAREESLCRVSYGF